MTHLACAMLMTAHDAEGDGKADRGQQQHRAEREPVPGVLQTPVHNARLFWIEAMASAAAFFTAGEAPAASPEQSERVLIAALANHGHGVDLVGIGRLSR